MTMEKQDMFLSSPRSLQNWQEIAQKDVMVKENACWEGVNANLDLMDPIVDKVSNKMLASLEINGWDNDACNAPS